MLVVMNLVEGVLVLCELPLKEEDVWDHQWTKFHFSS